MVDNHLGLTIVYNGAIYNYPELREQLQQKGYRFFSHGDTEVILKAYHAWGADCVQRLNGMFAFVIHERDTGKIFLARDRLGIKPLYYTHVEGVFRFASSLPALLKAGPVDTTLDPVALNTYMSFHSIVPAPRTLLSGVKKLPPASTAWLKSDGTLEVSTYWDVTYGPHEADARMSFEDWQEATLEVLRAAVKRRLIADVPVGVLLSGGLDSSLIVGLLCEHENQSIETFSIGFETVGNEAGDEFKYSDIIVERFGTSHHKLFVDSLRSRAALAKCLSPWSATTTSAFTCCPRRWPSTSRWFKAARVLMKFLLATTGTRPCWVPPTPLPPTRELSLIVTMPITVS